MTNSHPLHPFFTLFEPVAHPLQAVVLATVPFFFPTVSEAVHSDWRIYLLRSPERLPTICKSSSNLLLPAANAAIASTDVNDANCLVEDLWELQSDIKSAGQGSSLTQETAVQQSRKSEAIPQCKATKKTGCKVRATCHLWSFVCICWLAAFVPICTTMSLLLVCAVRNLIRKFVWHTNQCVLGR